MTKTNSALRDLERRAKTHDAVWLSDDAISMLPQPFREELARTNAAFGKPVRRISVLPPTR